MVVVSTLEEGGSLWEIWVANIFIQGDNAGRLTPPVDLVPSLLAAGVPLLLLLTAQAG